MNERKKTGIWKEIRELKGIGTAEAMRVAAELALDAEGGAEERFYKLVWYSDACGGRLTRFKFDPRRLKIGLFDEKSGAKPKNIEDYERNSASISRTKRRIYEIAACNEWEWFFTGTLDGEKVDRNNLNETYKRISQYFRDFRKTHEGIPLRYLIVPEQHKDGAWHFHGLLGGLDVKELHKFSTDEIIPHAIRSQIEKGIDIFTWNGYAERFGFSTLSAVRSHSAVSKYITKYITKDLLENVDKDRKGKKLYYISRGLNKPEVIDEGMSTAIPPDYDYENDYIAVTGVHDVAAREQLVRELFGKK